MHLIISGCLLGLRCRYDGDCRPLPAERIAQLKETWELIPVCPEQLGGLASPREPSERQGDRVVSKGGKDVTGQYVRGAEQTLYLAKLFSCKAALLKEKSPSCGRGSIYDGSFQKRLIDGNGVTAELLLKNGILVFGESQIDDLLAWKEKKAAR